MDQMRLELLQNALEILRAKALTLKGVLEGEDMLDDEENPMGSAQAFGEFHDSMQVYAEQFTAYENSARNGYSTISVTQVKD